LLRQKAAPATPGVFLGVPGLLYYEKVISSP